MNCYFIAVHRSDRYLRDLFRYLYSGQHCFVLHVDAKSPPSLHDLARRLAERFDNVINLSARLLSWAGASLAHTTLEAMQVALAWREWDHFMWLSELHLPLYAPDAPEMNLPPGVSYSDAVAFRRLHPSAHPDVSHRFAMSFRELPGVGEFGVRVKEPDPALLDRLYHGSNWMVLSRDAVALLLAAAAQPELVAPFQDALQIDENLLQTLLFAQATPITPKNLTFVAEPARSGNKHMIFTQANFADAKRDGSIFIRKRPDELPPQIAAELEQFAAFTNDELEATLPPPAALAAAPAATLAAAPEWPLLPGAGLFDQLSALASLTTPEFRVARFEARPSDNKPSFYVKIFHELHTQAPRLCVLSEDLQNFKLLLVANQPFTGFEPRAFAAHQSHLLRIRVHELFFDREILVDGLDGWCDRADLISVTHRHLQQLRALMPKEDAE